MSKMTSVLLVAALVGAVGLYQFADYDDSARQFGSTQTADATLDGSTAAAPPSVQHRAPVRQPTPSSGESATGAPALQSPVATIVGGDTEAPSPPPPGTSSGAEVSAVDETALRYFARQGDTRRLETEIARLRALYPDWTPPADPLAVPLQIDAKLDAMWQLYSQGKYAELRKAITDRQTTEPNWQPPQDLLDRLAEAQARERLINASDLKQYETVVRVAAETPSLLNCSEVDVLWRLAEAFAMTDRADRARDAYLYVLKNCNDAAQRLATLQKALPLLPRAQLDELLSTEKVAPNGAGEFASVRASLVRNSVAAGGKDPPADVPPADVSALEALASKDNLASDASLLGWYYLRSQKATKAQEWFAKAREIEDTAETSQGLALALIDVGRPGEAEDILYNWRDASAEVNKVYLAAATNLLAVEPIAPIDTTVLQRIVPEVAKAKDAAAAQQLGWYAHAFNQEQTAAEWFATALQWKPDDEPSAYGLAVVRMALRDRAGVAELQQQWASLSERIATITDPQVKTAALPTSRSPSKRQPPAGQTASNLTASNGANAVPASDADSPPASIGCGSTDLHSSLSPEAALSRGWCLMELNRPVEAAIAFGRALESNKRSVRRDAAYGQSLAYIRSGLVDKAAVAAAKEPQDNERAVEIEATILSMRATGFFDKKRYTETLLALDQRARIAPERLDLMTLRGYAYLGLRRVDDARQVFEALRNAGDPEGQRGLAAVRAATDPRPQD